MAIGQQHALEADNLANTRIDQSAEPAAAKAARHHTKGGILPAAIFHMD
jgi:hypothetical protein